MFKYQHEAGRVGFIRKYTDGLGSLWVLYNDFDLSGFTVGAFEAVDPEVLFGVGFSKVAKKRSRISDTYLVVLRPNVGVNLLFKPLNFNLDSYYSGNSGLVDCFWFFQKSLNITTFLNILISIRSPV